MKKTILLLTTLLFVNMTFANDGQISSCDQISKVIAVELTHAAQQAAQGDDTARAITNKLLEIAVKVKDICNESTND